MQILQGILAYNIACTKHEHNDLSVQFSEKMTKKYNSHSLNYIYLLSMSLCQYTEYIYNFVGKLT